MCDDVFCIFVTPKGFVKSTTFLPRLRRVIFVAFYDLHQEVFICPQEG